MPRPWRIVYSGAKYHVTSRGNARQRIFHSEDDYLRFLEQLAHCLEEDEVILYAYCLMPNHYHLLIETPLGNIKRFMQRLNTSYSMYYRYKHSKPGHCMQGRYGAKLVDGDDYIIRLTRYIHLNPIKVRSLKMSSEEKMKYLEAFKWSSLRGYLSKSEEIIDYRWLDLMHRKTLEGKRRAYRRYIQEAVRKEDKDILATLDASRYAIGDDKFIEDTEKDLKNQLEEKCVYGDLQEPWEKRVCDIEQIKGIVLKAYEIKAEDLMGHGNAARDAKALFVELSCRHSGKSQREIALLLGYASESSITKQRKRLKERLNSDKALKKELARLNKRVGLSIVKV